MLLREQHVTVSADGRVTTVTTYALRVLLREGREYAVARESYESDAGKVKEMHAWLIRPSGPAKRYSKDAVLDMIEDPDDIYNESRYKVIDGSKDADTGATFGYQTTTEERSIFSQDIWSFQNRLPAPGIALHTLRFRRVGMRPALPSIMQTLSRPLVARPTPGNCEICRRSRPNPTALVSPASRRAWLSVTFRQATQNRWRCKPLLTGVKSPIGWLDCTIRMAVPDEALTAKARQLTRDA